MATLALLSLVFSFDLAGFDAGQMHHRLTRIDVDPRRYDVPVFFPGGDTLHLFNDGTSCFGQRDNESELQFGPISVRPGTQVRLTCRYQIAPGGQARLYVRLPQQIVGKGSCERLDHHPSNRPVELRTVGRWTRFEQIYTLATGVTHVSPTFELIPDNNYQEPWVGEALIRDVQVQVVP